MTRGTYVKGGGFGPVREMPLLWAGIAALSLAIFVADTLTDLEIAFAVFYVVVILLSVRSGRPRAIMGVGGACILLTMTSYVLTRSGDPEPGLVNGALSLLAIGATTWLAVRFEAADEKARQARGDLARMSRAMIVGELGSSIAHEVSQPVTAIVANGHAALRWLSASPADEAEARRAVERVVRDAERAGDIIERVRRLMAQSSLSQERFDVSQAVAEIVALTRAEMRTQAILLQVELPGEPAVATGDRIQVQQVALNLIVNAIEALATCEPERRDLLVSVAQDDKHITVSVRDTGAGLPEGSADTVFEAFRSTKPTGMGMGLAVSRSIVEAHHGRIYAAPNFPHGAVFGFVLPRSIAGKE